MWQIAGGILLAILILVAVSLTSEGIFYSICSIFDKKERSKRKIVR